MKTVLCLLFVCLLVGALGKGNTNNISYAVTTGDLMKVKQFVAANPKWLSSKEGAGMLTTAAVQGQMEMVAFLISQGVNVNEKGFFDMTPLASMASVFKSSSDEKFATIATILIAHGAKVDLVDDYQETPLLHAVEDEDSQLAEVLLKNGASQANTYIGANFGMTPLHMAVTDRDQNMVAVLLKYNPPLTAEDRDGQTPLILAELRDQTEMAAMLRQAAHDTNAIPSRTNMRALAIRIASGDKTALAELANVDEALQRQIKFDNNPYPHVPSPWIMIKSDRMRAAFQVFRDEAAKGNMKAFEISKKHVKEPDPLADISLTIASICAAAGSNDALEVVMHHHTPRGSVFNPYLLEPAAANINSAVDYFTQWLDNYTPDFRGGPLMEVTNALSEASARGNKSAQIALEKFIASSK